MQRSHGGVDGNERLTASTAAVLLVLLALEGATLISWKLPQLALDRSPGRGLRLAAVAGAVACGLGLAVVTVPAADHWQDRATAALGIESV